MLNLGSGTIVRFDSVAHNGKSLNVYGTLNAADGLNVCLYNTDELDVMQQWQIISSASDGGWRLHSGVNNRFVLARSTSDNAQLNKTPSTTTTNSSLSMEAVSGETDTYRIKLKNQSLYLTAATTATSAPSSGSPLTKNGNVYWSAASNNAYQKWKMVVVNVQGGRDPAPDAQGRQKLILPMDKSKLNASYKNATYYAQERFVHYGIDLGNFQRPHANRTIYASGTGTVLAFGDDGTLGNVLIIQYTKAYDKATGTYKDVIFRYYHLDSFASTLAVGTTVTAGTVLGVYGNTGNYSQGQHLHLETDTDTAYPNYSPTVSGSGNIIMGRSAGATDATLSNPLNWLFCGSGQQFTVDADISYINTSDIEPLERLVV